MNMGPLNYRSSAVPVDICYFYGRLWQEVMSSLSARHDFSLYNFILKTLLVCS